MLVRTVVGASSARSAVGHQSASTVVSASFARSAVGPKYASTVVSALNARSAEVHDDHAVSSLRFRAYISKTISRYHKLKVPAVDQVEHPDDRERHADVRPQKVIDGNPHSPAPPPSEHSQKPQRAAQVFWGWRTDPEATVFRLKITI